MQAPASTNRHQITRPDAGPPPAAFVPSRGSFGGKTIVQPPGGHTTLKLFG